MYNIAPIEEERDPPPKRREKGEGRGGRIDRKYIDII